MIPPDLEQTVRDLDAHVAGSGWDQPPRLFAIAETKALISREPGLASQLTGPAASSPWTTIEQEDLPVHDDLDGLLGPISWPETVDGAAVSAERIMVTPDPVNGRQSRHELRVTMAVLRDGSRCTVLRLREYDSAETVIVGEDLVSGLGDLLLHTLT